MFQNAQSDTSYSQTSGLVIDSQPRDAITAGAGNDFVNTGAGNNTIVATVGDGNDSYTGGAGTDTYDLSGTTANATVSLNAGTATSVDTGADTLGLNTIENVTGGAGNDTMTGGGNNDVFKYIANNFGADTITDFGFSPGGNQDLIDVSGVGLKAGDFASKIILPVAGGNMTVGFQGGTILLNGVNKIGAQGIDATDFRFAPRGLADRDDYDEPAGAA